MFPFLLRRVLWLVPVMLVVAVTTFFLMYQAPGGPWDRQKPLPEATRRSLDAKFGLDKPLWVNPDEAAVRWQEGDRNPLWIARGYLDGRFPNYMIGVFQGDLGPSYASKGAETVQSVIFDKFPVSAKIGLVAIVFAVLVGLPLGIISALRQNTWVDYLSLFTSTIGVAVPTFVTGLLLIIFMSQNFRATGNRRPADSQVADTRAINRSYKP